jgi:hypothetical protein
MARSVPDALRAPRLTLPADFVRFRDIDEAGRRSELFHVRVANVDRAVSSVEAAYPYG